MKKSDFIIFRTVQIHETDLGGLVHHHNYFLWMEQSEYELFESLNEPVVGELDREFLGSGWPRSEVSMKYLEPLKFRDKLRIHLKLLRIRAAALEFETDFYRINKDGTETKVAVGTHKTIHCMYDATQRQNPKICPADGAFLERLEVYQEA